MFGIHGHFYSYFPIFYWFFEEVHNRLIFFSRNDFYKNWSNYSGKKNFFIHFSLDFHMFTKYQFVWKLCDKLLREPIIGYIRYDSYFLILPLLRYKNLMKYTSKILNNYYKKLLTLYQIFNLIISFRNPDTHWLNKFWISTKQVSFWEEKKHRCLLDVEN